MEPPLLTHLQHIRITPASNSFPLQHSHTTPPCTTTCNLHPSPTKPHHTSMSFSNTLHTLTHATHPLSSNTFAPYLRSPITITITPHSMHLPTLPPPSPALPQPSPNPPPPFPVIEPRASQRGNCKIANLILLRAWPVDVFLPD